MTVEEVKPEAIWSIHGVGETREFILQVGNSQSLAYPPGDTRIITGTIPSIKSPGPRAATEVTGGD